MLLFIAIVGLLRDAPDVMDTEKGRTTILLFQAIRLAEFSTKNLIPNTQVKATQDDSFNEFKVQGIQCILYTHMMSLKGRRRMAGRGVES